MTVFSFDSWRDQCNTADDDAIPYLSMSGSGLLCMEG